MQEERKYSVSGSQIMTRKVNKLRTKHGDYTINTTPLGKGSFGQIMLAIDPHNYQVVLKRIAKSKIGIDPDLTTRLKSEFELFHNINCPYICAEYASFQTISNYYISVEYCNGGDLAAHLMKDSYKTDLPDIQDIARQILKGLKCLHDHNIVHRDLKPANIFLHRELGGARHWKLGDFSISRLISAGCPLTLGIGTSVYTSPQVLDGMNEKNIIYTEKADMWAFGVILYELAYKKWPFMYEDYLNMILNKGIYINQSTPINTLLLDLIVGCLQMQEESRLDVTKALQHPFIIADIPEATSLDQEIRGYEDYIFHNRYDYPHTIPNSGPTNIRMPTLGNI